MLDRQFAGDIEDGRAMAGSAGRAYFASVISYMKYMPRRTRFIPGKKVIGFIQSVIDEWRRWRYFLQAEMLQDADAAL